MWVEIHDASGRVQVDELTETGVQVAMQQCEQLMDELREQEDAIRLEDEAEFESLGALVP